MLRKLPKKSTPRSPVPADKKIGERIRARRIELGMTQGILADHLGVTFQQVQKYEKATNRISATRMTDIAKFLDMQIEDFFSIDQALGAASLLDVTDKDMIRMLRAYRGIKDHATRRQMVLLIETIASAADPTGDRSALD